MTVVLETESLSVGYKDATVVDRVTLTAKAGQVIGLIGPNGAGKTSLIKALSGLTLPRSGRVLLDGRVLQDWSRESLARSIGYLSQDRLVHWPVTVERLVSLGRLPHRSPWHSLSATDGAAINEALKAAEVADIRSRTVTTLSGGELARVLFARILAGQPRIVLADEPVSGLDPRHRLQVLERMRALAKEGCLVIVVLHDLTLASRYCDRLILLDLGQVVADGRPEEVLKAGRVSSVYGVGVVTIMHKGERAILPWDQTGK